jgi:hypothetical protein
VRARVLAGIGFAAGRADALQLAAAVGENGRQIVVRFDRFRLRV